MLGDIDLIFVLLVYNNELQIKLTFRSGPMIYGRVMIIGPKRNVKSISPSKGKKRGDS
jgi:hypothetical protein